MRINLHINRNFGNKPITNRRTRHAGQFPLSDNLMSLVFLVQADLNEQQRERFVSSMNIRQIAMPQYTYLRVKQLFLELFAVSRTGVADPNITHRKRSTFYVLEEAETKEGEYGFWVLECLRPGDRISLAGRTKKPTNASERLRNAQSSARIRSGLDMWSGGIAKETHDLPPSRSRVSMCPWNERGHGPDLGVGHCHCRASTYKKKRNQWGHSLKMVRAYLHPML